MDKTNRKPELKPIYYYKHPFSLPRGGHLKTSWVWRDNTCFCHHSNVLDLFRSKEVDKEFTLVTEGADFMLHDMPGDDNIHFGFPHKLSIYSIKRSEIPNGLKKWYSTNVNLMDRPSVINKIECCPIGVYEGYHNNCVPTGDLERRMAAPTDKEFLCLMNFGINGRRERFELHNAARSCNWIISYENQKLSYQDVLNDIGYSKFVVCPISNGIETSRIHESIYLGACPIVLKSHWADNFKDLPILQLNSWNELNKGFLESEWNKYLAKKANYNYDVVDYDYWAAKIV